MTNAVLARTLSSMLCSKVARMKASQGCSPRASGCAGGTGSKQTIKHGDHKPGNWKNEKVRCSMLQVTALGSWTLVTGCRRHEVQIMQIYAQILKHTSRPLLQSSPAPLPPAPLLPARWTMVDPSRHAPTKFDEKSLPA